MQNLPLSLSFYVQNNLPQWLDVLRKIYPVFQYIMKTAESNYFHQSM